MRTLPLSLSVAVLMLCAVIISGCLGNDGSYKMDGRYEVKIVAKEDNVRHWQKTIVAHVEDIAVKGG